MIHFFGNQNSKIYAVQATKELTNDTISKLVWLFGNKPKLEQASLDAFFVGPRAAMITPWSTNAVEITQNMGIKGIIRIEECSQHRSDKGRCPSVPTGTVHEKAPAPVQISEG